MRRYGLPQARRGCVRPAPRHSSRAMSGVLPSRGRRLGRCHRRVRVRKTGAATTWSPDYSTGVVGNPGTGFARSGREDWGEGSAVRQGKPVSAEDFHPHPSPLPSRERGLIASRVPNLNCHCQEHSNNLSLRGVPGHPELVEGRGNLDDLEHASANPRCYGDGIATLRSQ